MAIFKEDPKSIHAPNYDCHITSKDMWWGSVGSSCTIYAGGLTYILLFRLIKYLILKIPSQRKYLIWTTSKMKLTGNKKSVKLQISRMALQHLKLMRNPKPKTRSKPAETKPKITVSLIITLQDWAERIISAHSVSGRVLLIIVFLLSFASLIIYFLKSLENYEASQIFLDELEVIDVGFNAFFTIYFGLRFLASADKLRFWFQMNTIVDIFTVPPTLVSLYFKRDCVGLRFLRSLRLIHLPEILQYIKILKKSTNIKLASLLCVFLGIWLSAAGFIQIIENSGDPWLKEKNINKISYWECVYLMMVTISTVGYGDVVVKTMLGQIFMMFFIISGLGLFARYVPEIIEIIESRKKYNGRYVAVTGRKHIILCGYITLNSLRDFLKEFINKEKDKSNVVFIVILENINPDLDLATLIKCNHTRLEFLQGSVLNPEDLGRAESIKADACLILADKNSTDPEVEDSANIMRAISVKQYTPEVRVIVQVLQYHSKAYLLNLPNWGDRQKDNVICLSQLKMGFIAQNCIVPGFSTLLANLFITKSDIKISSGTWVDSYLEGISNEIYTEYLSGSFNKMSFGAVCELCFVKLKILLIAIEYRENEESSVLLNPGKYIDIQPHTLGFFFARKRGNVMRARIYCNVCHGDIFDLKKIKKCACKLGDNDLLSLPLIKHQSTGVLTRRLSVEKYHKIMEEDELEDTGLYDSTGMFHWCSPRTISEVSLTRETASNLSLCKHIIVCVFGDSRSPALGLRNFIMPLRGSCFTFNELKPIVLVGSLDYLELEWQSINYFPKIFFMLGSPLSRADLKSVNIGCCDMCVILSSSWVNFKEKPLQDKECVLATLNIKGMLFEERLSDENFSNSSIESEESSWNFDVRDSDPTQYFRIPIITSLVNDSSVRYLDVENWNEGDVDLYLTRPYASGSVFAADILTSLMCLTYFNENILTLIRTLVTGGATHELDEQLADDDALRGGLNDEYNKVNRKRCKLANMTLCDKRFREFADTGNYGELFRKALKMYGILCFGLFRLQDAKFETKERYVITNPPGSFKLKNTDFVMCAVPYNDTITMETPAYCLKNYSAKFFATPFHQKKSINFVPPLRVSTAMQTQSRSSSEVANV